MNQNLQHRFEVKTNIRSTRQTKLRQDADTMLRDIAFVLKMTQRVREQMDSEAPARSASNCPATV